MGEEGKWGKKMWSGEIEKDGYHIAGNIGGKLNLEVLQTHRQI